MLWLVARSKHACPSVTDQLNQFLNKIKLLQVRNAQDWKVSIIKLFYAYCFLPSVLISLPLKLELADCITFGFWVKAGHKFIHFFPTWVQRIRHQQAMLPSCRGHYRGRVNRNCLFLLSTSVANPSPSSRKDFDCELLPFNLMPLLTRKMPRLAVRRSFMKTYLEIYSDLFDPANVHIFGHRLPLIARMPVMLGIKVI